MRHPYQRLWRGRFGRFLSVIGIALGVLLLAATAGLVAWEATWATDRELDGEAAFREGSIGTEIVPLAVLRVLPELVPEAMLPAGPEAGDVAQQFGFLRRPADDPYPDLPLGLTVSNYRPLSGAPSPIPFVGIGCAACHTTALTHDSLAKPAVIGGSGNQALDLIGFANAIQVAVTAKDADGGWRLTVDRIVAASDEEIPWLPDRLFIGVWLMQARAAAETLARTYDDIRPGLGLRDSRYAPVGPMRTTPFRSLVRRLLNRPGIDDPAYSKIPAVYHQGWKPWAQFDGSIRSPELRSALAAMTIMATRDNLTVPEIGRNVVTAAAYLTDLGGPRFGEVFAAHAPDPADPAVAAGRVVYEAHCASCHGRPEADGGWDGATERFGTVIPITEIGTDPARVTFRHTLELPGAIVAYMDVFPEDHPFRVAAHEIRPDPEDPAAFVPGYLAGPIDSAFVRAPFLHNASVPTLAELINLVPRRTVFCRGGGDYDPEAVGLRVASPLMEGDAAPVCDLTSRDYFLFDTTKPGNAASGHDYPWPYRGPGWNEPDLKNLLAYLKTF